MKIIIRNAMGRCTLELTNDLTRGGQPRAKTVFKT